MSGELAEIENMIKDATMNVLSDEEFIDKETLEYMWSKLDGKITEVESSKERNKMMAAMGFLGAEQLFSPLIIDIIKGALTILLAESVSKGFKATYSKFEKKVREKAKKVGVPSKLINKVIGEIKKKLNYTFRK